MLPARRNRGLTLLAGGAYVWQVGHQNRLRPSSTAVRIGVPHTRHGSPARR